MAAIHLAAALVAARHDQDTLMDALKDGIHGVEDREELLVETLGLTIGLLHAAGHLSTQVTMLLDVFARVPQAIDTQNVPDVHIINAEDIDKDTTANLFQAVTGDIDRQDVRLWHLRELPGGTHGIALEGPAFETRYIAVLDGTQDQTETLRLNLIALDRH